MIQFLNLNTTLLFHERIWHFDWHLCWKSCVMLIKCSPNQEHSVVYNQGSAEIYWEADQTFTSFSFFIFFVIVKTGNCVRSLKRFIFFDEGVGEEDQVLPLPTKNTNQKRFRVWLPTSFSVGLCKQPPWAQYVGMQRGGRRVTLTDVQVLTVSGSTATCSTVHLEIHLPFWTDSFGTTSLGWNLIPGQSATAMFLHELP